VTKIPWRNWHEVRPKECTDKAERSTRIAMETHNQHDAHCMVPELNDSKICAKISYAYIRPSVINRVVDKPFIFRDEKL